VVFQWLKDTLFQNESYEALFDKASEIKVGSDGLLCLPFLLGERAPLWNSAVRGGFVGLDMYHTAPHFVRAAMEGILLNMFTIGRVVMENQSIHTIYGSGGFAKGDTWVQMLSDVFGIPVHLNDTVETSSVGAALIGLKALGQLDNLDDPNEFTDVVKKYKPDMQKHRAYLDVYAKFAQWAQIVDKQSDK
jgi:gluconokinase